MGFENKRPENISEGLSKKSLPTTEELRNSLEQENNPELKARLEKVLGNSENTVALAETNREAEVLEIADLRINTELGEMTESQNSDLASIFAETFIVQ